MSHRIQRVQSLIMQEISVLIRKDVKDPRLQKVTITDVTVSHDCKNATIYYSVLGEDKDVKAAQEAFEKAIPFLRRDIGENIDLRYTPHLRFVFDDSVRRAAHISELLNLARHDDESDFE